jgi:phosphomannomutase
VRKSNTEPILRILAEGRTADSVDEMVRKTRRLVAQAAAAPKV